MKIFVCGTLISVKSKYGSCSGSCTGFVKIKKKKMPLKYKVRRIPSLAKRIEL